MMEEFNEYFRRKVDKNFEGRKIREFLKEKMGLSSRLIKGASIDKRILVNNNPVKMNYVLKKMMRLW